jgi:hypothetical protein
MHFYLRNMLYASEFISVHVDIGSFLVPAFKNINFSNIAILRVYMLDCLVNYEFAILDNRGLHHAYRPHSGTRPHIPY